MKFPWPLRFTIPGIILLVGLLLGLSLLLYEKRKAELQIEQLVTRHVQFLGNQISGVSSYFLRNQDISGLQRQISALGADPILRLAFVCNERLEVLTSSQFEFTGRRLEATPLGYARDQIANSK